MSEIGNAFEEAKEKTNKAVAIQAVKILFEKILKLDDSNFCVVDYVYENIPNIYKIRTKLRIVLKNGLSITIEE